MEEPLISEEIEAHTLLNDRRGNALIHGDNCEKAAALIDLAFDDIGLPEEVLQQPNFARAMKLYFIYVRLNILWCLNLAALILLNFFEIPLWCKGFSRNPCGNAEDYFLGHLPYLTRKQALICELVTLVILMAQTFFPLAYTEIQLFWKNRMDVIKVFLVAVLAIDILIAALYIIPSAPIHGLPVRLAPYLRVFILLVYIRDLIECMKSLMGIIPVFMDIAALLVLFLLFSSWLAYILFEDTTQGKEIFTSYGMTLYQMFVLFTTSNNPDVWLPAYRESRSTSLFFILYILFGVYFITNLILAVVYDSFKKQLAKQMLEMDVKQKNILGMAFQLLDMEGRGYLELEQCIRLFNELNRYRTLPKIEEDDFEDIFLALDDSGDFKINKEEFADLCEAITLKFPKGPKPSWLEKFPGFYDSTLCKKIKEFVRSRTFEYVIFGILMLNVVAVVIETTLDLENDSAQHFWQQIEFVFGWIYVVEVIFKVFTYGFDAYWHDGQNKFDFVITLIIVIGETLTFILPNGSAIISNEEWIRYLLVARLLRIIRLLALVERYRVIIYAFLKLIPNLTPYFSLIFCLMCVYCSLGLQFFGGLVHVGNPQLQETSLFENDYLDHNFNDYPTGMITLFQLLVMGNWQIWLESYVILTRSWWTVIYFISFYAIAVLFLLNLVVAFVLEAFFAERELSSSLEGSSANSLLASQMGDDNLLKKSRGVQSEHVKSLLLHMLSAELDESKGA